MSDDDQRNRARRTTSLVIEALALALARQDHNVAAIDAMREFASDLFIDEYGAAKLFDGAWTVQR